ncbi:Protein of unknown function [Lactobacillus delbrueckii subsp. bulgaricus]|nr:Protein of unknown function [Lactobacillus delbrueckii subsp. bulgaricus]CDR76217.1 Protein of unknown function [Lactobacillus delbrueckii subsp. bulgaricus]
MDSLHSYHESAH